MYRCHLCKIPYPPGQLFPCLMHSNFSSQGSWALLCQTCKIDAQERIIFNLEHDFCQDELMSELGINQDVDIEQLR